MCVGVEFLAFNVLLYTKSGQKVICNYFLYTNNLLDSFDFFSFNMKYTFTICIGIVMGYFSFEKQTFNGLIILYRVFIVIWNKVNHFLGRKNNFSSLNFFSLKNWKINIYEYLKTFHERQKFISEKASYFRCLKSSI